MSFMNFLGHRGCAVSSKHSPSFEVQLLVLLFNTFTQKLNHASQPWRKEEAYGPKQAHDDEHPKEDSVDHHGDVLPVLLHLWKESKAQENKD